MSLRLGPTHNCWRIAETAVELLYAKHPKIPERYPPGSRVKCIEDTLKHFAYMDGAEQVGSGKAFRDYIIWARQLFFNLNLPGEDFICALRFLADALDMEGGERSGRQAIFIRRELDNLGKLPRNARARACEPAALNSVARRYLAALLAGDEGAAEQLAFGFLDGGRSIASLYLTVIAPVMHEIGRLWHANRITVAQEHYCSACAQVTMARLFPRIFAVERKGPVLLALCAEGELHQIGIRMVADLFQLEGWDTRFLGADTPPKALVDMAEMTGASLVAISASILPNVPAVVSLISLLRASAGGAGTKILVGGYPFNVDEDLWRRVGADGTAADAGRAAALVAEWRGGGVQ